MLKQKKFIERVGTGSLPLLVLFLAAIPSVAQLPTGTILGVVKDSSGAVIPGTSLTITNIDTSLTRTGSSAEDGSYRFPALPVGRYRPVHNVTTDHRPGHNPSARSGHGRLHSGKQRDSLGIHSG